MLQLCVGPAYALCVHKVQALTFAHVSQGCLEGIFAAGQCYTQTSRATDPRKYHAIGVPPADLLDNVAAAVRAAKKGGVLALADVHLGNHLVALRRGLEGLALSSSGQQQHRTSSHG